MTFTTLHPGELPTVQEYIDTLTTGRGVRAAEVVAELAGLKYIDQAKLTPNGQQLTQLIANNPRLGALRLLEMLIRVDAGFGQLYGPFLSEQAWQEGAAGPDGGEVTAEKRKVYRE